MRKLILASTLLLAGCAGRPQQPVAEIPRAAELPRAGRDLLNLTPTELVGRFGRPALQVREGVSLKLQFRTRLCVLDAYFYPRANELRVAHVDARTPAGTDTNQAACISALENPS